MLIAKKTEPYKYSKNSPCPNAYHAMPYTQPNKF